MTALLKTTKMFASKIIHVETLLHRLHILQKLRRKTMSLHVRLYYIGFFALEGLSLISLLAFKARLKHLDHIPQFKRLQAVLIRKV